MQIANPTVLEPARIAAIEAAVKRIHERIDFRTPPFPFEELFDAGWTASNSISTRRRTCC